MNPQKVKLSDVVRGDTWPGISAITITVNGAVPAQSLSSARMQFRAKAADADPAGATLTSGGGGIVIDSAGGWRLHIPPLVLPMDAGIWHWDLQTTDAGGTIRTYVGGTIRILQDVTRS